MVPSMIKNPIDVKVVVLVEVSVAPFQHFMVCHDVFKSLVAYFGSKLEERLQTISRGFLDLLNCLDLCTDLGTIITWMIYECSA